MDTLSAALDNRGLVFLLGLGAFLVLVRSPWPWTRSGAVVVFGLWTVPLGLALAHPEARRRLLAADRLPALLFAASTMAALWWALHQSHSAREARNDDEDPPAWRGFSSADRTAVSVAILAVGVIALVVGAPLAPILDPARPPDPDRVPWLLLGLAESAAWADPWALVLLALTALWALPYLDVAPPGDDAGFESRRGTVYFVLFVWLLLAVLPLVQAALRPPVDVAATFPSLSARIWRLAGLEPPVAAVMREMPAMALGGSYLWLVPWWLQRLGPMRRVVGRLRKRLGSWRFRAAMTLMLLIVLVPIRMIAYWELGVGWLIDLPEIGLRF